MLAWVLCAIIIYVFVFPTNVLQQLTGHLAAAPTLVTQVREGLELAQGGAALSGRLLDIPVGNTVTYAYNHAIILVANENHCQ